MDLWSTKTCLLCVPDFDIGVGTDAVVEVVGRWCLFFLYSVAWIIV